MFRLPRTHTLICLVMAFIGQTISSEEAVAATRTDAEPNIAPAKQDVLLAQKKKRKKKKKKRGKKPTEGAESTGEEAPVEGAAPTGDAAEAGNSIHGAQESHGKYKWQVSLLSDFRQVSSQVGDAKSGSGEYDLEAMGLYVFGDSFLFGGGLDYSETTAKYEDATNKNTAYLMRLKGVYNFGNIHSDERLFFAGLSVGFGSSESKQGDADAVKSSVTQFGVGVGMHWFVDSNVAFTGEFSYDTGSAKADGADEATKFTEIHFAKLGFSLFI